MTNWFKGGIRGTETPAPRPATDAEKLRHWKDWKVTFGDFIVETYCHGIDVLNWFLGGHPVKALATGTQTSRRGDMRDQVTAVFTYPSGVQASLSGTQLTPLHYRDVHETFVGETSVVETARHYWKHYQDRDKIAEERETREITIDALEDFVNRVRDGRPENTGVRGAETTLTEILARMSMDLRREVTWEEMMR
jgi:predicted dehydrogenase